MSPKAVQINTGGWTPGMFSAMARCTGVLAINDEGCVYLARGSSKVDLVWPAGYVAEQGLERVVVRSADHIHTVAVGDHISACGGYFAAPPDMRCRVSTVEPFHFHGHPRRYEPPRLKSKTDGTLT